MQEIRRPFNGPAYELRIVHYKQRKSAEVRYRFLRAPVNFKNVTQRLKRMKAQAYGQKNIVRRNGLCARQSIDVFAEEAVVLEHKQNQKIRKDAQEQITFPERALGPCNHEAGYEVYNNGKAENQNVFRHKHHVEVAASRQKVDPAESLRQEEVDRSYKGKEYKKLYGVKKHRSACKCRQIALFLLIHERTVDRTESRLGNEVHHLLL